MTQILQSLAEISDRYSALFVDLWGCVHDGITPFPAAVQALQAYRKTGGAIVLVTNSPRSSLEVERQLEYLGVTKDAWDTIATSGDSARTALFQGVVGQHVYFIGTPEDLPFFDAIGIIDDPIEITRVPLKNAEGVICTGPFNATAEPKILLPELCHARDKGLKLLCANPDIIVDRGATREWCAGALAQLYTEIGGESLYFGKPHAPIYDLALRRLKTLGKDIAKSAILVIGDGPQTDMSGARDNGFDALFISGGLASRETQTEKQPDPAALKDYLAAQGLTPEFSIGYLR